MEEYSQITEFGKVLIFLIIGVILVAATAFLSKIIAPNNPNAIKNSSYECGEETTGSSWVQFNSRFYVIALIFLLFDVEMIFVFPWATVFADQELVAFDSRWGWLAFTEMMIFIGILLLGLVYVWRKKDLNWIRPNSTLPSVETNIPLSAYESINNKIYTPVAVKELENIESADNSVSKTTNTSPKFVPRFKKTS
ncbi:NADH-quinone oxidoreductase subunit A [Pseudoxanthomonas sp. SGD-10]|nr:NADH-quinone oxidoreductase subunit A [Pseudoxanthomonas sp. SGD-10]